MNLDSNQMEKYLAIKYQAFILLLISLLLAVAYVQQEYIVIPQISNMPVVDEVIKSKIIESYYKYRWLTLTIPLVVLLFRISLAALCLFLGSFFFERQQKIKYAEGWNIALKSDIILILFNVVICSIAVAFGAERAGQFNLYVSFAFLVDPSITEQWLLVPIAALNIFEVGYWFFMAKLVAVQTGGGYWNSFKFVLSTYGVGYLFYIVFLMFLLLYLTN